MTYHPSKCALNYTFTEQAQNKIHTLLWWIPRFLTIAKGKHIKICETEYVDNIIQKTQFKLRIKFCGENHDLIDIYYLYQEHVVLKEAMLITFRDNRSIFLDPGFHTKNEEILIKKNDYTVAAKKWQHLISLNKDTVTNITNLCDGLFKLKFQFTVASIVSKDLTLDNVDVPEHQLSYDFEYLLLDSMFSDVILKSAEGFEFKVHKVILSCRSTVLKAHFAHDTLENKINTIVSHLDTDVLKEVLTYIYTDRAPRVQEMPEKILEAAEYYNLPGLKNISEETLHLGLTKDNAIEILQLADLHSATYLKQLTLEFIKDGHAALVTQTDSWKSIKSIDIIKTLYEFIATPSNQ